MWRRGIRLYSNLPSCLHNSVCQSRGPGSWAAAFSLSGMPSEASTISQGESGFSLQILIGAESHEPGKGPTSPNPLFPPGTLCLTKPTFKRRKAAVGMGNIWVQRLLLF